MPKKKQTCPKCNEVLVYSRKTRQWYCPKCLLGAHLTHQAQQESMRKYRQSEKGVDAAKKYEQSDKGKVARERYLKSDKYKAARKRYNENLKESLRIAREVIGPRGVREDTAEEARQLGLEPVRRDIREYQTLEGQPPAVEDVIEWADEYNIKISTLEAQKLLQEM